MARSKGHTVHPRTSRIPLSTHTYITMQEDPEPPVRKSLHVHELPTKERIVKDVPPPAAHLLEEVWLPDGTPNLGAVRAHFIAEGRLKKEDALGIIEKAKELFAKEPNMVTVAPPVKVCGDVHGQFYDLMKLFQVAGKPSETRYLFLGDYGDRGSFGFETVIFMFCCKVARPNDFWMLRGNHECRHLTDYFNFKAEVIFKYGNDVYDAIMEAYDALPIAALMNEKFFCVHGGLSPRLQTLADLDAIDRFKETPASGLMCDLLWSDPVSSYNDYGESDSWTFKDNTARGCSYNYSYKAVCDFLDRNDLFCVIRGHEVQYVGYNMYKQHARNGFPSLITIFSAPNYCDDHGNKAAVLEYGDNNVMNIKQFTAVEHPYYLPNFSNVFKWSLPFVAEKIGELLHGLVKMEEGDLEEELAGDDVTPELMERQEIIKNKILALGRVRMMFSTLRKQRENIIKLKGLTGDNKLPKGVLLAGPDAIEASIDFFERSKKAHEEEERMPPSDYKSQEERDAISLRESLKMFKGK